MVQNKGMEKKKSRRKPGARQYRNYSEETLNVAVDLVKSKSLSSYEAEKNFGIPRRTILNKCKDLHIKSIGRPQELSLEEESHIAEVINVAAGFGSPLSLLDLRIVVYNYLEKNGKQGLFNGKMPGERWARNFLERYSFTQRSTQNIKRSRASKTVEEMTNYYENLESSIKDVPSANILNFDETNLSDDPGSKKAIFKRGVKHPERVLNSSKSSVSIMFSATADGECLPPYVVYKAEHLWSRWCEFGPPKARYNRTKSGWFDMTCFDHWFKTVVLPWADSRQGIKVIIGDNLASHLSVDVIKLCEEHSIRMVFLPPNSTHLTQPLDVSFFGPMKKSWREIMLQYKLENQSSTTINKSHFPQLLQKLMTEINMNQSTLIRSGFAGSGIFPFDPSRVIRKIPVTSEEDRKKFDVCLLEYLQNIRKPNTLTNKKSNKKLAVVAGKSISTEEANTNMLNRDTAKCKVKCKKNKEKAAKKKDTENSQVLLPPESLKELCRKRMNEFWNTQHKETANFDPIETNERGSLKSDVYFLSQLSKNDQTNLPFIAVLLTKKSKDCGLNSEKSSSKIKIVSDITIKPETSKSDHVLDKVNIQKKIKKSLIEVNLNTKIIAKSTSKSYLKNEEKIDKGEKEIKWEETRKIMKNDPDSKNIVKKRISISENDPKKEKTTQKRNSRSLKRRKKCVFRESSSISSENSSIVVTADTDNSDYETLQDYITECLEKENVDPVVVPFGLNEINFYTENDKFKEGVKHFVGQIVSLNNQIPTVKFLRRVKNSRHENGTTFSYPTVEDISTITHVDDIVSVLPEPQKSRRGQVIFSVNFTDFNIQ